MDHLDQPGNWIEHLQDDRKSRVHRRVAQMQLRDSQAPHKERARGFRWKAEGWGRTPSLVSHLEQFDVLHMQDYMCVCAHVC